ncbi:MAG: PD-(D/E)XK nuclease family protein [bacterium]|nr:PD-(D/E)XK nuclease family protein [Patescibacteria group bacterium]MDW8280006.1 PD-(D/E)XK nuclease family protein [bacterium]
MFEHYNSPEEFMEANGYIIDNVWYPRVTKIVSIKSKPALYYFYAEAENFKASQEITKESAKEGTLIHNTIEAILLGQNPEIDPSIKPSIDAFLKFLENTNIQVSPELIERRIVHYHHRYAGTVDAIALINGKFGVLDIKTSQAIYRDYNLQTSAYMDALKDEFKNLQTRWILKIDQVQKCLICGAIRRMKGGREKIRLGQNNPEHIHQWSEVYGDIEMQEFPYWQSDFEAFLGAKKLWEWENEYWLKKIGYL